MTRMQNGRGTPTSFISLEAQASESHTSCSAEALRLLAQLRARAPPLSANINRVLSRSLCTGLPPAFASSWFTPSYSATRSRLLRALRQPAVYPSKDRSPRHPSRCPRTPRTRRPGRHRRQAPARRHRRAAPSPASSHCPYLLLPLHGTTHDGLRFVRLATCTGARVDGYK